MISIWKTIFSGVGIPIIDIMCIYIIAPTNKIGRDQGP